jgi:cellulose synthase/poly-beta-1,6-N-acetylglucosamine synthase-like glycosyltransferase
VRLFFWLSALTIGYVYVGYPVVLAVWARIVGRAGRQTQEGRDGNARGPHEQDDGPARLPGVSIIIAARNEAERLPSRIENLLSLDYPAAERQIIVVSDGSTDDTAGALAAFGDAVDLVVIPPGGKAVALNAGVPRAVHEVLVFADARQTFAPGTLRALVAPLADATIGGVTGELVLDCESAANRRCALDRRVAAITDRQMAADRRVTSERRGLASTIADGVGLYWKYEKQLRRLESAIGSTLGATGAIYALRRSLWRPLPPDTILDDVLAPMRAVLNGQRVVFEERAKAFDRTAPDSYVESRRKVRTLAGNVQILALEPRLLVPFLNPVWIQYYSHKIGRLVAPYALVTLLAANIALAGEHVFYAAALTGQCVFYLLAGYGAYLEWRGAARAPAAARDAVDADGPVIDGLQPGKDVVNA